MTKKKQSTEESVTAEFAKLVEPYRGRRMGDERAERLMKQSFMGLRPKTCYWDPIGARVDGGVNLVGMDGGMKDMIMPALKAWNRAVQGGYPIDEAVWAYRREARKTLQSSSWNIPIYAVRGVPIVSPGALPAATLAPRITTDKDSIQTTPLTTVGTAAVIGETDNLYTYADDTYFGGTVGNYAFDIKGYGRGNKVSELMSMVGNSIENPQNTLAEAELLAIRRWEEIQIIQGTNNGVGFSGDASGFKGIYDWSSYGDFGYLRDMAGGALTSPDDLRTAIDTLIVDKNANEETLIGLTDRTTLSNIKNDLQDYVRTGDPNKNFVVMDAQNNINVRIRCVVIDGVKIFPSYGAPTTAGKREVVFMDLKDHYMGMVQDAILKPLAFIGPHQDMATDAYGTLVSEGVGHCGRIHTIA